MMYLHAGGRDGFLTALQEDGRAMASYTDSDDLVIVIVTLVAAGQELGLDVRVFPSEDRTLLVVPR